MKSFPLGQGLFLIDTSRKGSGEHGSKALGISAGGLEVFPVKPTVTLEVARQMVGCRKNPDGSCGAAGYQTPLGEPRGPFGEP